MSLSIPAIPASFVVGSASVVVNDDLPLTADETNGAVADGSYDWIELLGSTTVDICLQPGGVCEPDEYSPADGEEWTLAIIGDSSWFSDGSVVPDDLPGSFTVVLVGIEFDASGNEIGTVFRHARRVGGGRRVGRTRARVGRGRDRRRSPADGGGVGAALVPPGAWRYSISRILTSKARAWPASGWVEIHHDLLALDLVHAHRARLSLRRLGDELGADLAGVLRNHLGRYRLVERIVDLPVASVALSETCLLSPTFMPSSWLSRAGRISSPPCR